MAVKLSTQNQNLQNKAAPISICLSAGQSGCFTTPCCPDQGLTCSQNVCVRSTITNSTGVPCGEFQKYYLESCNSWNDSLPTAVNTVSCKEAKFYLDQYCLVQVSTTPTRAVVTPSPLIPTISATCKPNERRTLGRFILVCINGRWKIIAPGQK